MQDRDRDFFRIALLLRSERADQLSGRLAEELIEQVFRPVVRRNHHWVRSFFEEQRLGVAEDEPALACMLAGELWADLVRPEKWNGFWRRIEGLELFEKEGDADRDEELFRRLIDTLRNQVRGWVRFLFRDRARRPTLASSLAKLCRDGVIACSGDLGGQKSDLEVFYFPVGGEKLPELPPEIFLDSNQFQFPLPKGRGTDLTKAIELGEQRPTRTRVPSMPFQIPTAADLRPLMLQVFNVYRYRIPKQGLIEFLENGYETGQAFIKRLDDEDEAGVGFSADPSSTPLWLTGVETAELLEEALRLIDAEISRVELAKMRAEAKTFVRYLIWSRLEMTDGEFYTLEVYAERFEVPVSTASDHNQRFGNRILRESLEKAEAGGREAAFQLLEMLRERYLRFKPEFVLWESFKKE